MFDSSGLQKLLDGLGIISWAADQSALAIISIRLHRSMNSNRGRRDFSENELKDLKRNIFPSGVGRADRVI